MADISVNEYVRTIDGYIRKVTQYNEKGSYDYLCWGACMVDKDYKHSEGISLKKIKKHSFNLIDLIEVGDYVNDSLIHEVGIIRMGLYKGQKGAYTNYAEGLIFKNEDIQTIVTHEQIKSMEYKVGDEEQ